MKKLFLLLMLPTLGWCDTKISALATATSMADTDVIPVVLDPSGTPVNRKITKANLIGKTVTMAGSAGAPGTISSFTFQVSGALGNGISIQPAFDPGVSGVIYSPVNSINFSGRGVGFLNGITATTGTYSTSATTPKLIFSTRNNLLVDTDGNIVFSMPDTQTMYFGRGSAVTPTGGGTFNTAMGAGSMAGVLTGSFNTAYGNASLAGAVTGDQNNCIGYASCNSNTSGSFNNAMGGSSLFYNTAGGNNVAVGVVACRDCTSNNNTAIGALSNEYTGSGGGNTSVGYASGVGTTTLTNSNVLGSNNTYIGYQSGQAVSSMTVVDKSIAIGYQAMVSASNTAQIGGRSGSGNEVNVRASTITAESQIVVTGSGSGEVRFYDADGSNYSALKGSATYASDLTTYLPSSCGTSGQVLTTEGACGTYWSTAGGTPGGSAFQVQYSSANGTAFAGSPNMTNNGSTVTFSGVYQITETNVSTKSATAVYFDYSGSSMTLNRLNFFGIKPTVNVTGGATPTLDSNSNDMVGRFTWGAQATAGTVTFSKAWLSAPYCVAVSTFSGLGTSATDVLSSTFTFSGLVGSTVTYHCTGGSGR